MTKSSNSELPSYPTTGIGSLPSGKTAEVLKWAFSVDIPYLPELLSGVAGPILPTGHLPSLWGEFRKALAAWPGPVAKAQLFGLFTASRLENLDAADESRQVEWLQERAATWLGSARAMALDIAEAGKRALLFFDEPSWFQWNPESRFHCRIRERSVAILTAVRAEGALTGIHCCARADLRPWLRPEVDYLSFDAALSLDDVLGMGHELRLWMEGGGRLSFGIVPTDVAADFDAEAAIRNLLGLWEKSGLGLGRPEFLREALWTAACGLGLRDTAVPERVGKALAKMKGILEYARL